MKETKENPNEKKILKFKNNCEKLKILKNEITLPSLNEENSVEFKLETIKE